MHQFAVAVQAFVEFATEQLDSQDGEDEPKDQAYEQYVENSRDSEHQSVNDYLKREREREREREGGTEEFESSY